MRDAYARFAPDLDRDMLYRDLVGALCGLVREEMAERALTADVVAEATRAPRGIIQRIIAGNPMRLQRASDLAGLLGYRFAVRLVPISTDREVRDLGVVAAKAVRPSRATRRKTKLRVLLDLTAVESERVAKVREAFRVAKARYGFGFSDEGEGGGSSRNSAAAACTPAATDTPGR